MSFLRAFIGRPKKPTWHAIPIRTSYTSEWEIVDCLNTFLKEDEYKIKVNNSNMSVAGLNGTAAQPSQQQNLTYTVWVKRDLTDVSLPPGTVTFHLAIYLNVVMILQHEKRILAGLSPPRG